jgi:hypothetical protein
VDMLTAKIDLLMKKLEKSGLNQLKMVDAQVTCEECGEIGHMGIKCLTVPQDVNFVGNSNNSVTPLVLLVQMGFKFKFELFLNIPILVLFATCKGTSNFGIQVGQSKFTLWKMMSRRIFGEFMGFFSKGLNPFKIQASFKLEIPLQFIIRKSELIPTTKDVLFNLSTTIPCLEFFGALKIHFS